MGSPPSDPDSVLFMVEARASVRALTFFFLALFMPMPLCRPGILQRIT